MNKDKKIENCKNLITILKREGKSLELALKNYNKSIYQVAIHSMEIKNGEDESNQND